MDSFKSYLFRQAYKEIERLGDRLAEVDPHIDWKVFRPIIQDIYNNDGPQGGSPNMDPVLMVKLLVLQTCYGFSDLQGWRDRQPTGSASAGSSATST